MSHKFIPKMDGD